MLEIQGKGAYIFPSYLIKSYPNFSGYSCVCHETGITVIPWIGREIISNRKLYTNFWTVWRCIFAYIPFPVMRIKTPSESAEYGEQTWFDVLNKTKLKTHRAVAVSVGCFR